MIRPTRIPTPPIVNVGRSARVGISLLVISGSRGVGCQTLSAKYVIQRIATKFSISVVTTSVTPR